MQTHVVRWCREVWDAEKIVVNRMHIGYGALISFHFHLSWRANRVSDKRNIRRVPLRRVRFLTHALSDLSHGSSCNTVICIR